MDPSVVTGPSAGFVASLGTIIGGALGAMAYGIKWWSDRRVNKSTDNVRVALNEAQVTAAKSVTEALGIVQQQNRELRAQCIDLQQQLAISNDNLNKANAELYALRRIAEDLRSRMGALEDELHKRKT